MCVCVCVCVRKWEDEEQKSVCVCVCVCEGGGGTRNKQVCVREGERTNKCVKSDILCVACGMCSAVRISCVKALRIVIISFGHISMLSFNCPLSSTLFSPAFVFFILPSLPCLPFFILPSLSYLFCLAFFISILSSLLRLAFFV